MIDPTQDLLTDIEGPIVKYSTFWQRFAASFIDGLVVSPFILIDTYNKTTLKSIPVLGISFLITLLYKPFFESRYNATLGKMALNLTIVNTDFQKPETRNIILRNIIDITDRVLIGIVAFLTFTNVGFKDVSTSSEYTKLSNAEAGALWVTIWMSILMLVDAIFLIVDSRRQALHDKIGSTLVIQK